VIVTVSPDVADIVSPGLIVRRGVTVQARDQRLDAPLAAAAEALRMASGLEDAMAATRVMYKRCGIDTTKTRPSSEALLRRVRKGDPLPRVNGLVDIINWCSAESQISFGLYDLGRIEPPVALRRGAAGEGYDGIRKDRVNVEGRLTLADTIGPFGNPTSDSARTMTTPDTRDVLVVLYVPAGMSRIHADRALQITRDRLAEFAGGSEDATSNCTIP
jgi:DNA/RNA-binding domain of Phe-tRNA-synthetase-like protein